MEILRLVRCAACGEHIILVRRWRRNPREPGGPYQAIHGCEGRMMRTGFHPTEDMALAALTEPGDPDWEDK